MGLGAIVVIGAEREGIRSIAAPGSGQETPLAEPLAYVDILGRSTVERTIERLGRADVEMVTVLATAGKLHGTPVSIGAFDNVNVQVVADVSSVMAHQLKDYLQKGIEHSFVVSANVYAEADLLDLFYFHREARQAATRCFDHEGPLDLWVVDCAKAQQPDLDSLLTQAQKPGASYFIRDYVCRLTHPRDIRRLVSDALCGRCTMRPSGREIKPSIWVDEGAEIHRGARIVAPAYIGRRSKVQEDTLITRLSNIERDCYVDCGTVIEDSSILANTHVGIWLDVCHAIASRNKLLSLGRDVVVEISDLSVMRSNGAAKKGSDLSHQYIEQQIVAGIQQEQAPTPQTCGLEPILSRGD